MSRGWISPSRKWAAWHAHDAADFVDSIYHFHNIINAIAGNRFLNLCISGLTLLF